ncbi:MAG: hypothetical protein ACRDZP_08425 [Acidimicrobiales bacterium]
MFAEAQRRGHRLDAEGVLGLLWAFLEVPVDDEDGGVTLEALGVDADNLEILWDAACEDFGERTLGRKVDPGVLDPSMTVGAAAAAMAHLLRRDASRGD